LIAQCRHFASDNETAAAFCLGIITRIPEVIEARLRTSFSEIKAKQVEHLPQIGFGIVQAKAARGLLRNVCGDFHVSFSGKRTVRE